MPESKTSPRRIEVAQRRGEAIRLRVAGHTYEQIAAALGYGNRGNAVQDVQRALAATVAEPAAELRALELERLDGALRVAFDVLNAEHVVVSHGRVMVDPDSGQPLRDHGPRLAAIDRIVRISESRRKLLGLDKQQVDITVTEITQADLAFQEMIREQKALRATAREATQQHDQPQPTA